MAYSKTCPYCGEVLCVDENAKSVRCDACRVDFDPHELRLQSKEEPLRLLRESPKAEADRDGFVCANCGAQVIADETAVSTFCCFCGAPAVEPAVIEHAVEPDLILPFAVNRHEAQDRFARWFNKKKLIPPGFLETVKAGRISGIYVPFWLFDCAVETRVHAVSTLTETARTGKKEAVTARDTFHYRAVTTEYENVPADASEKTDGHLMNLLGPFDLTLLEPFDPAYMEGFYCEKPSQTAEQLFEHIRGELEADSLRASRETLITPSYAQVKSCSHSFQTVKAKYALFPIWTVNYHYKGYTHQFFMNGQTGKIVGEAPLSLSRTLQWFGAVAVGVAALGELALVAINALLK